MKNAVPAEIKALAEEIGTSINALIDDPNQLGEPWRSTLLELKGSLNASLKTLDPTDQVPASQEAHWVLQSAKNALLCVQNMINSITGTIKAKNSEYATALNSIPGQVTAAMESKIAAGEYVSKDAATTLASTARTEGETAGFTKAKLLGDRRQALALASIPAEVVAQAPDTILSGEEAAFNVARDAAKGRVEKLSGLGLTVATAAFNTLPWAAEDAYTAQVSTFEAIKGTAKGSSHNAAPAPSAKASGFIPPPTVPAVPATGEKPSTFLF